MLRSTVLVGLLMLPGAFLILGLGCIHPRLRKEIVRLGGLSSPWTKTAHTYAALRARPLRPVRSRARSRGSNTFFAMEGVPVRYPCVRKALVKRRPQKDMLII